MSLWGWVLIGGASWFAVSVLVGLALTTILSRMSLELSDLMDHEGWAVAPLMRTVRSAEGAVLEQEAASEQVARFTSQPPRRRS
jgi:hypothetical protein